MVSSGGTRTVTFGQSIRPTTDVGEPRLGDAVLFQRLLLVCRDPGEDLRLAAFGNMQQVDILELDLDDGFISASEQRGPASSRQGMEIVEADHVDMSQLHPLASELSVAAVAKWDHQAKEEAVSSSVHGVGIRADEIAGKALAQSLDIDL